MNVKEEIQKANDEALNRMEATQTILVDIELKAKNIVPKLHDNMILHAGPPITWNRMCGPMQGGIAGTLVYEGKANTWEEGYAIAKEGEIKFESNHDHDAVGPMIGLTSPNQPVFVLKDPNSGKKAFCTLNEGRGKVLRFGGFGDDVLENLHWMRDTMAPALKKAIIHSKGIDIRRITSESLHMGDEAHNRNRSGSYLFLSEITPHLYDTSDHDTAKEVYNFMKRNADIFNLNLSMPSAKLVADSARDIEYCTLVVAMARNGTDTGIQVSSLGRQWFAAPAPLVDGLFFPGYTKEDGCPDLGDSTITECVGIGGFAMASAPAIVNFVGGSASMALERTNRMYEITHGASNQYNMPAMDFKGVPLGIDIRKVVDLNQPPLINTGIAHKEAGIGQIGAGLTEAPIGIFNESLHRYAEKYNI